jgi:hypothetical protein
MIQIPLVVKAFYTTLGLGLWTLDLNITLDIGLIFHYTKTTVAMPR